MSNCKYCMHRNNHCEFKDDGECPLFSPSCEFCQYRTTHIKNKVNVIVCTAMDGKGLPPVDSNAVCTMFTPKEIEE